MENVKGMANKFDEIIANFKEYLGDEYLYDYRLLKVQDFGIPQNRERFIMIGNRMGIDLNEIFTEIERHKRPPFVLKDALFGLPHLEARKEKNKGEYESLECGFTERDFSYPSTDFYHFINGDRVITKLYNHKNRYNNLRDIEILGDYLKEQTLYMNPYRISCHIKDVIIYLKTSILNLMKIRYVKLSLLI